MENVRQMPISIQSSRISAVNHLKSKKVLYLIFKRPFDVCIMYLHRQNRNQTAVKELSQACPSAIHLHANTGRSSRYGMTLVNVIKESCREHTSANITMMLQQMWKTKKNFLSYNHTYLDRRKRKQKQHFHGRKHT